MNIAMWSGPRNLSTALMYSFAARGDMAVVDEPFFGAYLARTGADHPMRAEVLAGMETDAACVARMLAGAEGLYSKQMAHHMCAGFPRDWFGAHRHAFLIRHPARVVASYAAKRGRLTLHDIGFVELVDIFDAVRALGQVPVVVDSTDIRADPAGTLRRLCAALDLPWTEGMLHWPEGGRPEDGPWAPHWYGAVHRSTGFAAPEGALPRLEPDLQAVADAGMPYYDGLARWKV